MKKMRLARATAPRSDGDGSGFTRLMRASLGRRDTYGKTHPINEMRLLPGRGGFRL